MSVISDRWMFESMYVLATYLIPSLVYTSIRVIVLDNGTRCARNGLSWYIIALFLATGGSAGIDKSFHRHAATNYKRSTPGTHRHRSALARSHRVGRSLVDPVVSRENARQMARRGAITKLDEPWRILSPRTSCGNADRDGFRCVLRENVCVHGTRNDRWWMNALTRYNRTISCAMKLCAPVFRRFKVSLDRASENAESEE